MCSDIRLLAKSVTKSHTEFHLAHLKKSFAGLCVPMYAHMQSTVCDIHTYKCVCLYSWYVQCKLCVYPHYTAGMYSANCVYIHIIQLVSAVQIVCIFTLYSWYVQCKLCIHFIQLVVSLVTGSFGGNVHYVGYKIFPLLFSFFL